MGRDRSRLSIAPRQSAQTAVKAMTMVASVDIAAEFVDAQRVISDVQSML